ncbi:PD-(D/E)XK nuclease family protein [Macrococcoides canis]|uniref:PD-(D/E)XK nuclease superfamily domain-containing protein n=1 Tax=Macrococcoides canis TaxID=1855823 RepID=A0A0D6DR32_9STAP|nr:PD-(D/E)XK nuclease family protein [Macrococcus canis]ARQ05744.1 PD-(D/E)XK nuclease superfamily domain-containing protein [Macrococcus canis]UTH02457.1 PD-(D/E)XK nuclease family protein [Macrococcus canis]WBF52872.1 PD-(D/E)XK nuclease family protein [Macrococcus canis]CDO67666.1 PD-(D/E)XK nuclease superfamily domain-containing protein [Macrococcus canis]
MTSIERYLEMINNIPAIDEKVHSESIAKIFGIESKENVISNWLAFLLDPNRIKSDVPLKVFLSTFLNDKFIEDLDYTDVIVTREYVLDNMRRVDIVIQINEVIIGIENKIFAALHNDQLNDYHYNLSNIQFMLDHSKSQQVITLLLAPSWSKELSGMKDLKDISDLIDEEKHQTEITYELLAEVFSEIPQKNMEYRHYFILNEFVKYINDYIKEEAMELEVEWANFNSKYSNDLSDIYHKGNEQLVVLSDKIEKFLNEMGIELFGSEILNNKPQYIINKKVTPKMFYFQLFNDQMAKYDIHYEIGSENYESKGFILPTNLKLTIDFENRTVRNQLIAHRNFELNRSLEFQTTINVFDIDYSSEKTIDITFGEIRKKLSEWHRKNYELMLLDLQKC